MLKGSLAAQNDVKRGVFCSGKASFRYWDGGWRDAC